MRCCNRLRVEEPCYPANLTPKNTRLRTIYFSCFFLERQFHTKKHKAKTIKRAFLKVKDYDFSCLLWPDPNRKVFLINNF